jgi:hypothetical protein
MTKLNASQCSEGFTVSFSRFLTCIYPLQILNQFQFIEIPCCSTLLYG